MEQQVDARARVSLFPISLAGTIPDELLDLILFGNVVDVHDDARHARIFSELLGGAVVGSAAGGPAPASAASVQALKVVTKDEKQSSEEECSICLEKLFEKGRKEAVAKEMPCGHRYHGECIEKWLHSHGSCPLCRYQMPVEEDYEEMEEGGDLVWIN